MSLVIPLVFVAAVFGLSLAVVVFRLGKRSVAELSFAAGMLGLAVETACNGMGMLADAPAKILQWHQGSLLAMAVLPGTWLVFSLSYSRGNYREFLGKWRWMLAATFALPAALVIGFGKTLIQRVDRLEYESDWLLVLGQPGILLNILALLTSVIILMNVERTFSTSMGTMRWRIKFMVLGLGVLFVARIYSSSQVLLYSSVKLSLMGINACALLLACFFMGWSLWRSRLFDVDVYPSQALLFNSLTVLLAGLYLLIVGALANLVTLIGGARSLPLTAFLVLISLVLLAMLYLSDRIRQRIKRIVSRHFHRPFFDYREMWTTFTSRTASLMNEADLCREVTQWVSEVFHVLSVTIWRTENARPNLVFGASTSLTKDQAREMASADGQRGPLIQELRQRTYPFDIDQCPEKWTEPLKQGNPDFFHKGGGRICVPIIAGGELLGLMTLCDRVSGVPFSIEDFDLLKCIGDQVAANLLNIQLSGRLLQAKEMESFQSMSAFFVHDLKNTASTLSLMLQNLRVHFADPAFREDALRAVSKSVNHLNELIGRLSLLKQELKLKPTLTDLNEVANAALAGLEGASHIHLVKSLGPLPKIPVDAEQIEKVVVNLLLNARDAIQGEGEIRVATALDGDWAVLAVSDNGCGMSSEFLAQQLFRPFQTTKKNGIGIGMFHSKLIVGLHRGRMEVASAPGQGTTFRVLLPLQGMNA
jgi:putative PEP-CTERM system histidine kinase